MAIDWSLGQGNNALAMFQYGAQLGQQAIDQRDQREHRNALLQQQQARIDEDAAARQGREAQQAAEAQAKEVEAARKALGNAAYDIIQTPPEGRSAKWDAYAQQFDRPDLVGQYSDQALNEVVAQAGLQENFQRFQQPRYEAVGEGGLVGFQYGQPIQQGGQVQDFGPPAPAGVTFTPIDEGGPGAPTPGAGFPRP